jgi:NAD(P)-dependent dehydrogenase (short-subunit alcohol dehydrogenase family)
VTSSPSAESPSPLESLAALRRSVSQVRGAPMIARLSATPEARGFANLSNIAAVASRGALTPDHTIRTKLVPVVLSRESAAHATDVAGYADRYRAYFTRNDPGGLTCLDAAPRWAVWPGVGTVAFGGTVGDAEIITDIARHTVRAIQWAEALGGWTALPEKDLFDVEYWELEQAKLRASGARRPLQGKIALVTGAASGIGRACVEMLAEQGAAVVAVDINPAVATAFKGPGVLGIACDVTDRAQLRSAVETAAATFGGLDILVSNAGVFSPSRSLADMTDDIWQQSLALNLGSHQDLLQLATPYLKLGMDACVIINASKNVPAPGPGAGAYSVAKAGLTQLARVAALELAPFGVRVNVLHPHAVFDTGAWTPEVLAARASHYSISVDEYKRNNLLKVEVTSRDVGALVCAMAGAAFAKTTGAQVPIDGGSDRVI